MKKFAFFIVAILFLTSCGGEDKPEDETTKDSVKNEVVETEVEEIIPEVIPEKVEENTKGKFYKHLSGSFSAGNPIEMDLTCLDGKKLTGSYFNKKQGKVISIHGKIDEEGNFSLKEVSGELGTFKGKYSKAKFSGKWKSGKTSDEFSFEFQESYDSSIKFSYSQLNKKYKGKEGGATEFRSFYTINSDKEIKKLVSSLLFPQGKAPDEIKSYIENYKSNFIEDFKKFENESNGMGWEISATADIVYNYNNFLSYAVHTSAYEGGAHGSFVSEYIVLDTKNKKKLILGDFIGEEHTATLSQLVYDKIKYNREFTDEDMKSTYDVLPLPITKNFYVTATGITLSYQQYEIAPYAAGPDDVTFSYEEVKNLIQPVMAKQLGIN